LMAAGGISKRPKQQRHSEEGGPFSAIYPARHPHKETGPGRGRGRGFPGVQFAWQALNPASGKFCGTAPPPTTGGSMERHRETTVRVSVPGDALVKTPAVGGGEQEVRFSRTGLVCGPHATQPR